MSSKKVPTQSNSLFAGLSADVAADITKDAPRIKFRADTKVSLPEPKQNCLYLIVAGSVRIKDAAGKRSKSPLASTLSPGDSTGELQLFAPKPFRPDLHALEDGELLQLSRASLVNILYFHPVVLANLVRRLALLEPLPERQFTDLLVNLLKEIRLAGLFLIAGKIDHEIKSPLTVITLTAQLIEGLLPESLEFTNSIQTQVHLLEDLVHETQNLLADKPLDLNIQKVDLGDWLADIKDSYGTSLESRNIKLRVENKYFKPVYFDAERIRRVVSSLLRNSSEALREAGEISIVASVAANWLLISLSDNGPGIPPSIVPHLFEPFVNYGKEMGLGLSLPICAKLVKEHSGVLEYQPVKPHGSRFDIRLPLNSK